VTEGHNKACAASGCKRSAAFSGPKIQQKFEDSKIIFHALFKTCQIYNVLHDTNYDIEKGFFILLVFFCLFFLILNDTFATTYKLVIVVWQTVTISLLNNILISIIKFI